MSAQDYYDQLTADRAGTARGSVQWTAPRPERPADSMGPRDLQQNEFTLRLPNTPARTHSPHSTPYQRAADSFEHLAQAFDAYRDAITPAASDPRYPGEVIREHLDAFRGTPAWLDAERQVDVLRNREELAKAKVEQERAALSQPLDSAGEQRNSRAWDLVKMQVEAAKDGDYISVVDRILAGAKDEQLGMLVDSLPILLQSKGVDTSWLEERFAARAPQYGAAKRSAAVDEQARIVAEYNLSSFHRHVDGATVSEDRYHYHSLPLAGCDAKSRADLDSAVERP